MPAQAIGIAKRDIKKGESIPVSYNFITREIVSEAIDFTAWNNLLITCNAVTLGGYQPIGTGNPTPPPEEE